MSWKDKVNHGIVATALAATGVAAQAQRAGGPATPTPERSAQRLEIAARFTCNARPGTVQADVHDRELGVRAIVPCTNVAADKNLAADLAPAIKQQAELCDKGESTEVRSRLGNTLRCGEKGIRGR